MLSSLVLTAEYLSEDLLSGIHSSLQIFKVLTSLQFGCSVLLSVRTVEGGCSEGGPTAGVVRHGSF